MSLANWTSLSSSIGTWLKRSDYTAIAPDLITMAEQDINDELRVNQMEAQTSVTSTAGYLVHPSDWLSWKEIEVTVSGITYPVRPGTEETVAEKTAGETSGAPRYYVVRGDKTYIKPNDGGAFQAIYYQSVPALSSSNTTNWALTRYPQLYLYTCLAHAKLYFDESTLRYFEGKAAENIARIRRDSQRRSFGRQVLQMKPDIIVT